MISGHACLHTEFIHGGDIPFPTEHKLSRLSTPPIEYMLNGYNDSALNGLRDATYIIVHIFHLSFFRWYTLQIINE